MDKSTVIHFTKKHLPSIIGIFVGAIAGYVYYFYIGCSSGTCSITSNPTNSTIYGSFMGFLIAGLFEKKDTKKI